MRSFKTWLVKPKEWVQPLHDLVHAFAPPIQLLVIIGGGLWAYNVYQETQAPRQFENFESAVTLSHPVAMPQGCSRVVSLLLTNSGAPVTVVSAELTVWWIPVEQMPPGRDVFFPAVEPSATNHPIAEMVIQEAVLGRYGPGRKQSASSIVFLKPRPNHALFLKASGIYLSADGDRKDWTSSRIASSCDEPSLSSDKRLAADRGEVGGV